MSGINMKFSKVLEMFKLGMKSDAVARPPRATEETAPPEARNENVEYPEEQEEEIIIESVSDDDFKEGKKSEKKSKKKKKKFFQSKKQDDDFDDDDDDDLDEEYSKEKRGSASSVNVQATGTVYNIVNAKGVRLGNDYYFGPVTKTEDIKRGRDKKYEEEVIEKNNFIKLLMEATIKPDHDYIDYISKNLGKNWHTIFRALGFTQGRIETAEINAAGYDISEARYKLLLDWVNNDDIGTLGRLATLLWDEGERSIVRDLSVMYKKSKKK